MILFYTKIVVLSIQMKAIAKIIYDGERKWERAETGIVQMSVLEGKVDENCSKIRKAVESHAAGDIDLLCFPELCISGYDFESAVLSDGEAAFFSELAAEYEIAILAGIHMPEGDKHYDTACIWDEKGRTSGRIQEDPPLGYGK